MNNKTTDSGQFLSEAYSLKDEQSLLGFYEKWAEEYDQKMLDGLGYVSPQKIAHVLANALEDTSSRILDLGCGTGLCGVHLNTLGYSRIEGFDLSQDMIKVAAQRGVYSGFETGDMNQDFPHTSDSFDGAICAGTFTHGHVGAECLHEVFRVLRPGGVLACTVHFELWESAGFKNTFQQLESDTIIRNIVLAADNYFEDSEPEGWFCAYKKV